MTNTKPDTTIPSELDGLIDRIGERIADEVERIAWGGQSNCEQAARDVYAMFANALQSAQASLRKAEADAEAMRQDHADYWGNKVAISVEGLTELQDRADRLQAELDEARNLVVKCKDLVLGVADRVEDEGDRTYLGSTNDTEMLIALGRELDAMHWRHVLAEAPGHTDLMVSPESIDAFMEANPLPVDASAPLAPQGSATATEGPRGYHLRPADQRCRCPHEWTDGAGGYYCRVPEPPLFLRPDEDPAEYRALVCTAMSAPKSSCPEGEG